jgi:hypothetical protein
MPKSLDAKTEVVLDGVGGDGVIEPDPPPPPPPVARIVASPAMAKTIRLVNRKIAPTFIRKTSFPREDQISLTKKCP